MRRRFCNVGFDVMMDLAPPIPASEYGAEKYCNAQLTDEHVHMIQNYIGAAECLTKFVDNTKESKKT